MRVDKVMLLSCLFLIGPGRDRDHNNSFVEAEGGGNALCTRAVVCACACVCVYGVCRLDIVNWWPWASSVGYSIILPCPSRPEKRLP